MQAEADGPELGLSKKTIRGEVIENSITAKAQCKAANSTNVNAPKTKTVTTGSMYSMYSAFKAPSVAIKTPSIAVKTSVTVKTPSVTVNLRCAAPAIKDEPTVVKRVKTAKGNRKGKAVQRTPTDIIEVESEDDNGDKAIIINQQHSPEPEPEPQPKVKVVPEPQPEVKVMPQVEVAPEPESVPLSRSELHAQQPHPKTPTSLAKQRQPRSWVQPRVCHTAGRRPRSACLWCPVPRPLDGYTVNQDMATLGATNKVDEVWQQQVWDKYRATQQFLVPCRSTGNPQG
ncbi:hypothetical protein OH76DRAFT_1417303 [Lentinus brumalis]|uniref:Uncharacterized protein n=1 Tax=Lentinus brumalis TaxID=2498619 RepID=A0A371DGI5_9APHY|nr:hypothetical protein OH76DRAFT_1417303 [Polyporus brumalis]